MSEANAIFTLDGSYMKIQCKKEEKMKDICERFASKIQKDMNLYVYLYGGNQLNFEKTYEAHLTDNASKEMIILAYKKEDLEYKCTNCGEQIKLNKEKIDEIILNNYNIKDKINGIIYMIDNIIKTLLINAMNLQLKNINVILNNINDDIKKNNVRLENLIDNIIVKDVNKNKNIIKGILDIDFNDINKNILLFKTNINNNIDIYINNEKINVIKDNNKWTYIFKKEGKYTFKIIFNNIVTNMKGFFEECSNIISLDFTYFNTSNIPDMAGMFNKCHKLKEIKGISKFNTSKIKDMEVVNQIENKDSKIIDEEI